VTGPAPAGGGAPAPIYASDQEFFNLFLGVLFARSERFRFCQQWADHEEATFVIKVLHDTYEAIMANSPTEIGVWLRDYAYVLFFDRLCAPNGTFFECGKDHTPPTPLGT
jgi:hypothetical protein